MLIEDLIESLERRTKMRDNLPVNKLHDVVRRARDQPVDDPAKKLRERLEGASAETVMILDVSGSMMDALSGKRKFDYVEIAAKDVWKYFPAIRTVVFDSISRVHRNGAPIPFTKGGTALHLALRDAAKFKPSRTIVVTDGHPDNAEQALQAAEKMTGRIDFIYCGPEGDDAAMNFLEKLARSTGGGSVRWDQGHPELLGGQMIRMLQAPNKP